jgi:hypothetical protein
VLIFSEKKILVVGDWFIVLREKYCSLAADEPD